MDHADSQVNCVAGGVQIDRAAINQNPTLGGLVEPVDDIHEG